jgi:hypothetical protein
MLAATSNGRFGTVDLLLTRLSVRDSGVEQEDGDLEKRRRYVESVRAWHEEALLGLGLYNQKPRYRKSCLEHLRKPTDLEASRLFRPSS